MCQLIGRRTIYLYGVDRIGELQSGGFLYHLTDALGSVRQLVDAGGLVELAQSYEPYGSVLSSSGTAATTFGFTGEQSGYVNLIYLRARWMITDIGRFVSKDTFRDYARPQALNGWSYALSNPTSYTDPSGHDPWWCESEDDPQACYDRFATSLQQLVQARVYYLNQIGHNSSQPVVPDPNPADLEGYILYRIGQIVGPQNVESIPDFGPIDVGVPHGIGKDKGFQLVPGNTFCTRFEMLLEMGDVSIWSQGVANTIHNELANRPLVGGERLVIIGNSGGGTVAVEAANRLQPYGVFVNQLILRGSPVIERGFSNVGHVDYITSEFHGIPADYYYYITAFPRSAKVTEHKLEFVGHVPSTDKVKMQVTNLIVSLVINGAR